MCEALVSNAPVLCWMYILAGRNQRPGASCARGNTPPISEWERIVPSRERMRRTSAYMVAGFHSAAAGMFGEAAESNMA